MAYNLESLVLILDQILHSSPHDSWILDPNKKPEIESLLEKAHSVKDFFENSFPLTGDKIESLESRITNAVHEAEDILESHLADGIRSTREGEKFIFSPRDDLQKVVAELDYVEKEVKQMMSGSLMSEVDSSSTADSSRSITDLNPKNIMVGFDEDLIQLKDRVTGQQAKLEIIPVVGMAGIGKTALAQNVYDDALIIYHFHKRAWIVVSQDYDMRGILLGLFHFFKEKRDEEMSQLENEELEEKIFKSEIPDKEMLQLENEELEEKIYENEIRDKEMLQLDNEELEEEIYKSLCGKRYLIVLDDVWDSKVWNDIKKFLPNNNNGSRVLITTRESNVAEYVDSTKISHHKMHFLNPVDSWNLFCQKVFAQENCPHELEEIGQKIVNNCGGLPLAIHVIGGVLSQAQRTQEAWSQVAEDVSFAVAGKDGRVMEILSLSYNYLPLHLRPCFLYMGAFPEDQEIRASKLVSLWVAEGFLKPSQDKSLEEVGEMYLKALVDRNLILVHRRDTNGNVKSCGIHDLLRALCVTKARQEKLFSIKNQQVHKDITLNFRRVSARSSDHIEDIYSSIESMRLTRSFLFVGYADERISYKVVFELRLLRVLNILEINFDEFPAEVLQIVNLRYLALASHSDLPSSITRLWNLQTLIFNQMARWLCPGTYLRRLRHIKFSVFNFKYDLGGKSLPLLENLQTLTGLIVDRDFDKVLESVPNLNKLGIFGHSAVYKNIDLSGLSKLKTLIFKDTHSLFSFIIFPHSLRKLTLKRRVIHPESMKRIATLLNLEVLKLRDCIFEKPTWEATEGEFCKLQFLLLESRNLVNLVADETHFPRLRHLVIRYCDKLKEIPLGIGGIPTLEMIEVHQSSPSLADSARKINEEQLELGNDCLQVRIMDYLDE